MDTEACAAWLTAWAGDWLTATYAVADRHEPVASYVERAGREPLDEAIGALCATYLATDAGGRALVRAFFDKERAFRRTLMAYVFRMATALRREAQIDHVRRALVAAAIEDAREDYRDFIVALIVLRWAALRVGLDPAAEFVAIGAIAGDNGARFMRGIPDRSVSELEHTVRSMTAREWRAAFDA